MSDSQRENFPREEIHKTTKTSHNPEDEKTAHNPEDDENVATIQNMTKTSQKVLREKRIIY